MDAEAAFLHALHPADTPGVTELRAISATRTRTAFVDQPPDGAGLAQLVRRGADFNLYVGVAKRRDATAGTKDNLAGLYALFADVDFAATPEADARQRLAGCPLPPSAIVASGGGLHVYWCLIEPLDAVAERARAEALLRRLAVYVGGDLACAEVARVLRVPGSRNLKYTPARPVVLEQLDAERNYNASDFDEWLPADPGAPKAEPAASTADGTIPEGARHRTLLRVLGAARREGATAADLRALADSLTRRMVPPYPAPDLERDLRSVAGYAPDPTLDADDVVLDHDAASAEPVVRWRTAREICTHAPAEPELIVAPYFYAGATTQIVATPKRGKSTLRNFFIRCGLRGVSSLGYAGGEPTPVVLATEEPDAVLAENLRAAGLADADGLHFVTQYDVRALKWPAVVAATLAKCQATGARFAWIDTVTAIAKIVGDDENKAGVALAVMAPLAELTAAGIAVGLVMHERKAGGALAESGRGSSAFAGAVDVLVSLRAAKGLRDTCRELHAVGRFRSIPPRLTVELVSQFPVPSVGMGCGDNQHTFVRVDPATAGGDDTTAQVLAGLPATPEAALSVAALEQACHVSGSTLRRCLESLESRRQAGHVGSGTRYNPARYYRLSPLPNIGSGNWEPEVEG